MTFVRIQCDTKEYARLHFITFVTLLAEVVPVIAHDGNVENKTCLYLNLAFVE